MPTKPKRSPRKKKAHTAKPECDLDIEIVYPKPEGAEKFDKRASHVVAFLLGALAAYLAHKVCTC